MHIGARALVEAMMALLGIFLTTTSLITLISSGLALMFLKNIDSQINSIFFMLFGAVIFLLGIIIYALRNKIARHVSPLESDAYVHPQSLVAVGTAVISVLLITQGILEISTFLVAKTSVLESELVSQLSATIAQQQRLMLISGLASFAVGIIFFALSAKIGRAWSKLQSE